MSHWLAVHTSTALTCGSAGKFAVEVTFVATLRTTGSSKLRGAHSSTMAPLDLTADIGLFKLLAAYPTLRSAGGVSGIRRRLR